MTRLVRWLLVLVLLALGACRIETATPHAGAVGPADGAPRGEVWVYTSAYRHVLDALDPVLKEALPDVTVHWYQAGSEKVAARLEAELAAGGTQCDVLATSDPFLFERFKDEGRWLRYASPNSLRTPRGLMDDDGHYASIRLSTMVLVHRKQTPAPASFDELTDPKWRDAVVLGDPLTSGTAYTWSVVMEQAKGADYFQHLRDNGARVAGGNSAVLQKVEGHEADVGVVLLENILAAQRRGSPLEVAYPADGAVLIPGYAGVLKSSRNPVAAKAVLDVLHSPKGQEVIARPGDMHAVDPRVAAPGGALDLTALLEKSQPWNEAVLRRGLSDGARVKAAFGRVFAR